MANKFTRRFYDTSTDPTSALTDAITVKVQEVIYGATVTASAITLAIFATEADSGWRRGTVTNPGNYYIFFDDVLDSDNSPIYIGTDITVPVIYIYKNITITGTYDSVETLTTGAGKLAATSFGGTPYFTGTGVEIFISPITDRNIYWDRDNIAVASNQLSFEIWAGAAGVDDTAICDIIIFRA